MTQLKTSCHSSHIPMASTLRRGQLLLPFFSDNQNTRSIIYDATWMSNDLNKYLFVPCHTKDTGNHFASTHFLLSKLLYFHYKFTLRLRNLFAICRWDFQIDFCLCINCCTLIIYSPGGQNKMVTVLQKIFWTSYKLFFFYEYYCMFIKLTVRLKQNCDRFVVWLNSHWGRSKNGHHFAHAIFNLIFLKWNCCNLIIRIPIEVETKWPSCFKWQFTINYSRMAVAVFW